MTLISTCPACGAFKTPVTTEILPVFRHLDFTEITQTNLSIGLCNKCGAIYNAIPKHEKIKLSKLYQSSEYELHQEAHGIKTTSHDKMVPKSEIQIQLLDQFLNSQIPISVLDIGCFNGLLLQCFYNKYNAESLYGFDVAPRPNFPSGEPFSFTTNKISSISQKFDLIVLSHSLQYVENLSGLFLDIQNLLKPKGIIFVQTPNIMEKQSALSLGDQLYHFTPNILCGLLHRFGFHSTIIQTKFFPRDLIIIAERSQSKIELDIKGEHDTIRSIVSNLVETTKRLQSQDFGTQFGVFGTAIDAAFIDNICQSTAAYFVDENPQKIGGKFRNRQVVHPEQLKDTDNVLFPREMFQSALLDRLRNQYKCRFLST